MGQSSVETHDWRKAINWAFLSSICSLLFSSPYFITVLDLSPVQMAWAWDFTTCHWRWSFPVRPIRRKVTLSGTDQWWDLWVRTIAYVG